jgi:hypothetical protein
MLISFSQVKKESGINKVDITCIIPNSNGELEPTPGIITLRVPIEPKQHIDTERCPELQLTPQEIKNNIALEKLFDYCKPYMYDIMVSVPVGNSENDVVSMNDIIRLNRKYNIKYIRFGTIVKIVEF